MDMQTSAWFEVKDNGSTFLYADMTLKQEGNFEQEEVVVLTGDQEERFLDFLEANGLYTDGHCEGPISYFEAMLWGLKPDNERLAELKQESYLLTLRIDDENGDSEKDEYHNYEFRMPEVLDFMTTLRNVVARFLRSASGQEILRKMSWQTFNWGDAILQVDWASYGVEVLEVNIDGYYTTHVVRHDESLIPE